METQAFLSPHSRLPSLPVNVMKLRNILDKLAFRQGNFCGKHDTLKTRQMISQQTVPPALIHDIIYSLHTTYEQARQYLQGQLKTQLALFYAKLHSPTNTEGQMILLLNSSAQTLSPKLHFFSRGLYKITQICNEMIDKICGIETSEKLNVPPDRMKPCRSARGRFVSPLQAASTPLKLLKENLFNL